MRQRSSTEGQRSQKDRDGETRDNCSKDGGSSYSERSGRKGHARGGSEADGVPQTDAATLEHQVREDCTKVAVETSQPMGGIHLPGSGLVDSGCLAEGIWLSNPGRRHGDVSNEVCR